jgi:hypothetical protein
MSYLNPIIQADIIKQFRNVKMNTVYTAKTLKDIDRLITRTNKSLSISNSFPMKSQGPGTGSSHGTGVLSRYGKK